MKKIIIKSSIILLFYTLINVYFAVFNWKIFSVKLNVDLGFAVLEIPPFVILFLAGFILIAIISWINYSLRLRKLIHGLEQGAEIGKLKNKLIEKQLRDLLFDEKTLTILSEKLGIRDVQSKTEVLARQITELSQKIPAEKNKS
jgi:hypothetical protein